MYDCVFRLAWRVYVRAEYLGVCLHILWEDIGGFRIHPANCADQPGHPFGRSLLAVIEIIIWLIVTSTVLNGFQTDPIRIVFYAAAFGMGNFIGSWLDEKLAFGLSLVLWW